ncbi:DUF3157 family protein [Ferrimonas aestuarii]|uniref:DUF3157 family protein n=1 Tax=Ferrimonas aestuarii TaxID=2569539 RepID=A0A4U1BQU3_9GAMM|nr:DUF3157 family protein [Ferrimonas aestuarii]TKB56545.1 DUF3157 family protein [Ferrimonas aestuarii]
MNLLKWAPLLSAFILAPTQAADQILTLEDGRQILLKDDFTWQYMPKEETKALTNETMKPEVNTPALQAQPIPTQTAKLANSTVGVAFSINQQQPIMQISQAGFHVVLESAHYEDGELVIPTTIHNNGIEPVVEIYITLSLYDANGQLLAQDEYPVWQAIKRMASTYLRPGNQEKGTDIRIELPKHSEFRVTGQISDTDTRG